MALAAALALVGAWAWISTPPGEGPIVSVEDPGEASRYAEIVRTGILTSQNFVGHRIRVVEGTLRNVGERPLRSVLLRLSFESVDGPPVLESEEEVGGPLAPGAERRFEFRYENLPENWNYRVPVVSVIGVGYSPLP